MLKLFKKTIVFENTENSPRYVVLYCCQTDTFHVEAIGLGELRKILIGYESGPRWSLDKVTIRESDDAAEEYVFTR